MSRRDGPTRTRPTEAGVGFAEPARPVNYFDYPLSMAEANAKSDMGNWETCAALERSPDRVSGAWVFRGTRVPVAALFENLKDGASVEDFLAWFPGVERA